jgi:subtilase family serine protease
MLHVRNLSIKLRTAGATVCAGALAVGVALATPPAAQAIGPQLVPLARQAPETPSRKSSLPPACTAPSPDPSGQTKVYQDFHCYTAQDILAAYGVDQLHDAGTMGAGQTIVLVDAYGSPTAKADLQHFHDAFFASLPNPNFDQVFPQGAPDYKNTYHGNGQSGPNGAAGWSGEATLDIEWSYAIAPLAHIVLLAVPPAETEGVQGFPNLFKAMSWAIDHYPAGTIFSQSFGVTEQTFGGAQQTQTARFDAVYKQAAAKGDTMLASSGDDGTLGTAKQHKETTSYSYPTVGWPASSPYVTAVGGTQLQYGWTWAPTSDVPFNADGSDNPAYFNWTQGGNSEAVWNESWLPAASGGGPSAIYSRPSWQSQQASIIGSDARGLPDLSWNAAVNGGVLVWITAFPNYQRPGWHVYGGTSAASPQVAGIIALANEKLADANSHKTVGALNKWLYQIGDTAGSSTSTFNGTGDFRDIIPQTYGIFTLENNTDSANADGSTPAGSPHGWPTLNGWDMTTGFGSPRASAFVNDLAAAVIAG